MKNLGEYTDRIARIVCGGLTYELIKRSVSEAAVDGVAFVVDNQE